MRATLVAIAMAVVLPGAAAADDRAELLRQEAGCYTPVGWSIFDVHYKDRYTHISCNRAAVGDERFSIDFRTRLPDGQITLVKTPVGGQLRIPVYVDGPVMLWDDGKDGLFRTDLATGAETRVATTVDETGAMVNLNTPTPGDNGFYVWRSETGGEFYARRLHIGVDGTVTDMGKPIEDGPVFTLPQQFDAPAVAYTVEGEHRFVKRMYAAKSGQLMFDEAFFEHNTRIQTNAVGSEFYASRDGTRAVGALGAGLFDKTHPDYPRYVEVVMIDRDRGVRAHRVGTMGNLGSQDVGISPDGRYFFVKEDNGFEIREFWTARLLFKFVPKHPTTGNPGNIVFVSDTQVVLIDGDDEPVFFTFAP